jgi:predicted amidohydrolase YtcJ
LHVNRSLIRLHRTLMDCSLLVEIALKTRLITVFCVLSSLLFCALAAADTLLHSVRGYTSTASGDIREFSVLVFDDDGRIRAAGSDELLTEYAQARKIDGGGRFVLPGLIDSHGHVSGQGFLQVLLDVTGVASVEEGVAKIAAYNKAHPGSGWITGRGWNQVLWPVKEFPTAAHIDAVVADRPVWLNRIDGHAGWANSKALELAGIDDKTPDPVGGKIHRDNDGHATGVLVDNAMDLVASKVPAPQKEDYRQAFLAAFAQLTSLGLTSAHDAGIGIAEIETLMSMADNDEMSMRIYAMIAGAGDNLDAVGKPIPSYGSKDRLAVMSVKLMADGALGSRGAAMVEPYSDDAENRGLPFWTQQQLDDMVKKANGMGFQVAIHAIGDYGNQQALDAFSKAQGGKPSTLRNRVEHAQIIRLVDIPRFAELGVIASMQATHATSDMNMAEDRIGPERIKGAYAWRKLLDSGAVIANGSDFPVELPDPMHGLYASVSRKSRAGLPEGGWYAGEALTRAETLHSWTYAAAYAAHQEDRLGTLEPDKWADFIVVDRDFFTIPESEIDDIKVLQTWVGGELVYERCNDASGDNCANERTNKSANQR